MCVHVIRSLRKINKCSFIDPLDQLTSFPFDSYHTKTLRKGTRSKVRSSCIENIKKEWKEKKNSHVILLDIKIEWYQTSIKVAIDQIKLIHIFCCNMIYICYCLLLLTKALHIMYKFVVVVNMNVHDMNATKYKTSILSFIS